MDFQLKKIVLWPRHGDFSPRTLSFTPGVLNVITGASKTGKSAIIPIIDYCLAATECRIPVETIRNACAWFGTVFALGDEEILLARREPGDQRATGDMFVMQAETLDIPYRIERKNTTAEAVRRQLDEMAGLTKLDFDFDATDSGFKARPSFRDMTAFTFQPQNIVANPMVLFYKADTAKHREKLRTIFPLVLGAVTPETLALRHRLRELRRQQKAAQRDFDAAQAASRKWVAELRSKVALARELGLIASPVSEAVSAQEMIDLLRAVADHPPKPRVSLQSLEDTVSEVVSLEAEETAVSADLAEGQRRLSDMRQLRQAAESYRGTIAVKIERLGIAEWLSAQVDADKRCPVCGGTEHSAGAEIAELLRALRDVEGQAGDFQHVPAAFDREHERIEQEVRDLADRLDAVRTSRKALAGRSEEYRAQQYTEQRSQRFLGGLDEALVRFERIGVGGDLRDRLDEIEHELSQVRSRLRVLDSGSQIRRALDRISLNASRHVPETDAEFPEDPVALSIEDLTLKIRRSTRDDYLWEIGSGANWVAYHVAMTLALHEYFLELPQSSVPSFLVYDQPSQVYFPQATRRNEERLAGQAQGQRPEPPLAHEDVVAVQKIFRTVAGASARSEGRLQTVILDHAGNDVWGDLHGVTLVEEWRHGRKLVPEEWVADRDSDRQLPADA